ncbi:MAG: VanZ family protein [Clostridiales bacterium]|nr:VanZ family protein [Clostridiales bacterium]
MTEKIPLWVGDSGGVTKTETAYYLINLHLPVRTWPFLILIGATAFVVDLWWCGRADYRNVGICPIIFCAGLHRDEKIWYAFLKALLITSFAVVLFTTLIVRTPADSMMIKPVPLWSWRDAAVEHNMKSLQEIILNIILFFPIGFLLHILYHVKPGNAFLTGLIFSAVVETLQLVTHLGFFEWDDMLHNGLGCLTGALVARIAQVRGAPPESGL